MRTRSNIRRSSSIIFSDTPDVCSYADYIFKYKLSSKKRENAKRSRSMFGKDAQYDVKLAATTRSRDTRSITSLLSQVSAFPLTNLMHKVSTTKSNGID